MSSLALSSASHLSLCEISNVLGGLGTPDYSLPGMKTEVRKSGGSAHCSWASSCASSTLAFFQEGFFIGPARV